MKDKVWELIAEREHPIYEAREEQLEINLLGLKGGRPYVDARLSRFAAESNLNWEGGRRKDGSIVSGRKQQTHCIPYLGRIAEKINQHVLGIRPVRAGAAPEIISDITSDGESLNQFIRRLNSYVTACRWAWVGLDMANIPAGSISQAEKEAYKIRPYWKLYSPLEVVDWLIDAKGGVQWVLTEESSYIANDPRVPAISAKTRRLWEPGKVTTFVFGKNDKIEEALETPLEIRPGVPLPIVPLFPVGDISADPHQFDNLESINRTIMDLESANRQNYFQCMFPQIALPASILETVKQQFEVNGDEATSMIMGLGYPILLNQGDPTPAYIMPDASGIGKMREEISALKAAMFEVVGLMLQQETKQVASAEAKAWDYLDVTQVMRERAEMLEEAEKRGVQIMTLWDSSIQPWEPVYNREFDLGNFKDEINAIVQASTIDMPDELKRFMLSKLYNRLKQIGSVDVDSQTETGIMNAIQNFAPNAMMEQIPGAIPQSDNNNLAE